MPYRVAENVLNASTLDILNVIRQNASYEYQSLVPAVTQATDIPKVGEVLYGHPALANQFLNALINRIALVRTKGAVFNNNLTELKKGYLEFGETVEEVFVAMAKAVEFSAEKAAAREFKRTIPDVKSAMHVMNYRAMYPVTIQQEDLRRAFLSMDGVQDLIARIVEQVYTAASYDEWLLMKALVIIGVNNGAIKSQTITTPVGGDADKSAAIAFRALSNRMQFVSDQFNASGVHTSTRRDDQYILMDAAYNATFDVNVLSAAFNMDKAEFMGHLKLVDDWTTFDNDRFDIIRANTDGMPEITDAMLSAMSNVKAVIIDREWFQVYDNLDQFTEKYVASGLYWNYFYHNWKTISWSPFSNAVALTTSEAASAPASIVGSMDSYATGDGGVVMTFRLPIDGGFEFLQSEDLTELGIAVDPYGTVIVPAAVITASSITSELVEIAYMGTTYELALSTILGYGGPHSTTFAKHSN